MSSHWSLLRRCSAASGVVIGVLLAGPLRAASPVAEALFVEGRRLLEEGRIDEACLKLGESFAQEASSGTLLNLALCHETQGRLATAWAEYRAAARLAAAQGREDRVAAAREKELGLEPRLPRLTVVLTDPSQQPSVTIDGTALGGGALGVPVPVDPGTRTVVAGGAGLRTWSSAVAIAEAQALSVQIPVLEAEPESPPVVALPVPTEAPRLEARPATAPPPDRRPARGERSPVLGYTVAGAGLASLGLGAVFGLVSLGAYGDAEHACPRHVECSAGALADRRRAETTAWVSNIALGVGLVATGVGVALVFTSGPGDAGERTTLRAAPVAGGAWMGLAHGL